MSDIDPLPTDIATALAEAVRERGLGRVAAEVGLAQPTLRAFLDGGTIRRPTRDKLLRWSRGGAAEKRQPPTPPPVEEPRERARPPVQEYRPVFSGRYRGSGL
ncbi:MAG TPA: hypothetical protein VE913_02140 [Longimicrobium sp.]|nr:hypothetical protein [Longimicrobium sp.]